MMRAANTYALTCFQQQRRVPPEVARGRTAHFVTRLQFPMFRWQGMMYRYSVFFHKS